MHVIKARFLPRNLGDALRVMIIGAVQVTILMIAPSIVVAALFGSLLVGLLTFIGLYLIFILFTVKEVRLSEAGIEFVRICGVPKNLVWGEVVSVELASAREVILKGWLWPMFPAREMTPSLTSIGHYRIIFDGGYAYYPPRNAEEFERFIPPDIKRRSDI